MLDNRGKLECQIFRHNLASSASSVKGSKVDTVRIGVPSFSVQQVTVRRANTGAGAGAVPQAVDFTSTADHF